MINGNCQSPHHNPGHVPPGTHILTFARPCGCDDEPVTKPSVMCYDHAIAWKMRPSAMKPSRCGVCKKINFVRLRSADRI